jgi:chlorobactene glucosyltransferase
MTILLLAFPWIAVLIFLVLFTRVPSELPLADALDPERALRVSVVIPARNEAVNIENCLASIAASTYPDFEIIVVDDRSGDGTAALARSVPTGNAGRITVIDGKELPEGWLGKPWAVLAGRAGVRRRLSSLHGRGHDAWTANAQSRRGRSL